MSSFGGRVTHLVSGDLWGGAEALVLALARQQQRVRPGSVSCVVMNPGELASRLSRSGIPTRVLDEGRQSVGALLREVIGEVRRLSPQVLHAHRRKENLLATLTSLRLRGLSGHRRPRCLTTMHGMPEPYPAASGLRRAAVECANFLTLRFGLHAIVAVSQDMARALRPRYGRRVVTIHNGIEIPEPPAATPDSRAAPGLRLVALGRLVTVKRFERLGGLSEFLTAQLPWPHEIVLAGEGPLAETLREVLRPGGPGARISMPGFVADTRALLGQADALVMTSDHEGIPMAALEALALGVPVFAFGVGGLPEIAASGVPLRLAPPGNVSALAAEIVTFFKQNPPGIRLAPPQDWSFDIRQCARAYEALYGSL